MASVLRELGVPLKAKPRPKAKPPKQPKPPSENRQRRSLQVWAGEHDPATIEAWSAVVHAMARRRRALGYSQPELDERIGLALGHISKFECFLRRPTAYTFSLWARALGCRLVVVSDDGTEPQDQRDRALVEIAALHTEADERVAKGQALMRRARRRDEESRRRAAALDRQERELRETRQKALDALGGIGKPTILSIECRREATR